MTQGGYQVIIILPIKRKMTAAEKQCFLRFLYLAVFTSVILSRFTNDYKFSISVYAYQ